MTNNHAVSGAERLNGVLGRCERGSLQRSVQEGTTVH
jgi:hypothetical protein